MDLRIAQEGVAEYHAAAHQERDLDTHYAVILPQKKESPQPSKASGALTTEQENLTMNAAETASTSTNSGDVTRRALRHRLRSISLEYDPDKPAGIPAELSDLWDELADELDRLSDWLSEAGSIGGMHLYRGASPVADMYTRCVRKRWQTAVDRYIENLPADICLSCARTHAALDAAGLEYEVLAS